MTRISWFLQRGPVYLLCAAFFLHPDCARAGKLDRASDATDGREDDDRERRSSGGSSTSITIEDDDAAELALVLVYYVLLSPFSIPHHLAHKEGSPERVMARRPFEAPGCGLYCPLPSPGNDGRFGEGVGQKPEQSDAQQTESSTRPVHDKRARLVLGIEGGIDPAPLPLAAVDLRAMTALGIGVSTRVMGFREQREGDVDLALLGKSHLLYRFATTSHLQFRAGLGARYFATPGLLRAGFDFLYGFDIQWAKPVFSQFEFGLGMVGRAFAPEARGTVGVYLGKAQLYVGWDQNWVGGVPLGGALLGLGGIF